MVKSRHVMSTLNLAKSEKGVVVAAKRYELPSFNKKKPLEEKLNPQC